MGIRRLGLRPGRRHSALDPHCNARFHAAGKQSGCSVLQVIAINSRNVLSKYDYYYSAKVYLSPADFPNTSNRPNLAGAGVCYLPLVLNRVSALFVSAALCS